MDTKILAGYYNNAFYQNAARNINEAEGELSFSAARELAAMNYKTAQTAEAAAVTPQELLKEKYPNAVYHVFDASSGYWKTRTDYPHYLLYQDSNQAKEVLSNWQPDGENPFYGSKDGRFIAPKEIHALSNVPPGSKAVVIHPDVQEKMEQDPKYAAEIIDRIDAWFQFDIARNNAISGDPTYGSSMSQAVAIGEDGNIVNACSSRSGAGLTYSSSGTGVEETVDMWEQRLIRHKKYMKIKIANQIEHNRLISRMQNLAGANEAINTKQRFKEMLDNGNITARLGSKVAGIQTEQFLDLALSQIFI